jgi:hypothetical protein
MSHGLWLYVHILLFVYWLGADLGVLLLAFAAKRSDLSFTERAFALKMATLIDFTPRICFALMFPVGLQLTASGFADIPAWALISSWIIAAGWITLLFALARAEGTAGAQTLNRAHLLLQAVLLLVVGTLGIRSWMGEGPFPAGWLAAKITLFAAIFAAGIGIDYAFRPIIPAFMRLAAEGSKPEIETAISRGVDGAIRYVLTLYALLLIIALLGTVKPF